VNSEDVEKDQGLMEDEEIDGIFLEECEVTSLLHAQKGTYIRGRYRRICFSSFIQKIGLIDWTVVCVAQGRWGFHRLTVSFQHLSSKD